ncbi:hypothetical protein [Granulicella sp. L60]|jgi:hypothetical protein|nr:hypothetical protein [Granulicella sp. L60]
MQVFYVALVFLMMVIIPCLLVRRSGTREEESRHFGEALRPFEFERDGR